MNILITGAAGFIGHYLVEEFSKEHKVFAVVRPGTKNLGRLDYISGNFQVVEHDIKNPFNGFDDIDIILHAGANPSTTDSLIDPEGAIADNIFGTLNLLQLARKNKTKKFVYYSSGEVFGPIAVGKDSHEDAAYDSVSPYAASKAAGEELCLAYSRSYNLPMSIIHINNTFGPRCQSNRFPVIAINKILKKEPIIIHASSDGIISGRRWFYAGDVASHTQFILNRQTKHCEKWNSAGETFINNLSLALEISDIMGIELKYNLETIKNNNHNLCFSIDPQKIYDLGWTAPKSHKERLTETVDWYINNQQWLVRN